ncbi:hypothetical protein M2D63_017815 [Pseudomonas sp. BJa5]|uniref:hypothetical protein n=1 Tax=Pseudomonas sp. BJa5 TaxID=2936270 RepID=UPI002559BDA9|nr:hypothetical protein [Pseudomonas sp. BGr12]MDL2422975.1 hypothetical protein [Pseudomonas sp. BGr12]
MQDEFFQDQSIEGIEHALIRETIQNSLDARLGKAPVRVVLSLGKLAAQETSFWFCKDVQAHFSAKEIRLSSLPNWEAEDCAYLAIEDFGTKGLEGEIDSASPETGGNFYHFFRAEGVSNKKDGDRGSWGVGKIVIPRSSRIRSFFAVTRRASEPGLHLMGQSILRHHEVNGTRYTPDGWFSRHEGELQTPFTSDSVTNRLKKDFRLTRENEPGLGVVIPWVYEKYLTIDRLAAVIAREYFIPILEGDLVVELRDNDNDNFVRFDSSSYEALKQSAPGDEQFQDSIQLACNLLRLNETTPLEVTVTHESGSEQMDYDWASYKTNLLPQDIESALDHGRIVHFKVPMTISRSQNSSSNATFDVLIMKKSGRHYPVYVRDGLIIPNQPTRRKTPETSSLIHVSRNAIADALRRSECPAHTDWKASRDKFREQNYKSSNKLIPFVRESAHRLLEKLSIENGTPDHSLLAELLPLPSDEGSLQPEASERSSNRKKENKKESSQEEHNIPAPKPRSWSLRKTEDEVHLTGNPDGFVNPDGYRFEIHAAYDLYGRNPFKAHSKYDFDLFQAAQKGIDKNSKFQVTAENVTIEHGSAGSLVVVAKTPEFKIIFRSADLNRDLVMKIKSTSPENSAEEGEEEVE